MLCSPVYGESPANRGLTVQFGNGIPCSPPAISLILPVFSTALVNNGPSSHVVLTTTPSVAPVYAPQYDKPQLSKINAPLLSFSSVAYTAAH